MMAAFNDTGVKNPVTGEQPKIDPRAEMLQVIFASIVDSMKQDFEAYVRKIVTNVLDERDEALLEKLNKIAEAQDKVSASILESGYNKLSEELREEADKDGWIKWEPEFKDYRAYPDTIGDTFIEVEFRCGATDEGSADIYDWSNEEGPYDIVKYRVVKD